VTVLAGSEEIRFIEVVAIAMIPLAYLLGAVPSGYLIGKLSKGIDIREHGSGKTGMSNVLRSVGKKAAFVVLLSDFLKGMVAVILVQMLTDSSVLLVAVAIAVLLGHNYSIFIGFHGGAGVLTGVGTLFAFIPLTGVMAALVGGLVILLFRYMSLGSLTGTLAALLTGAYLWAVHDYEGTGTIYILIGACLIFFRHKENIYRLAAGKEPKIGNSFRAY
jgi:glycerol-3-phosphate acyltransferase PlsY